MQAPSAISCSCWRDSPLSTWWDSWKLSLSAVFSVLVILVFGMAVVFDLVTGKLQPLRRPHLRHAGSAHELLVDSLSIGIWMYCGLRVHRRHVRRNTRTRPHVAKGFRIALPLIALFS